MTTYWLAWSVRRNRLDRTEVIHLHILLGLRSMDALKLRCLYVIRGELLSKDPWLSRVNFAFVECVGFQIGVCAVL